MKGIRITISVLLALGILFSLVNVAFAGVGGVSVKGDAPSGVDTLAGKVLGAGQVICYVAAVILIMWMGVKWLTAAPEGKAEMKKGLIIAAVASALLVGAGVIMNYVGNTIQEAVSKS